MGSISLALQQVHINQVSVCCSVTAFILPLLSFLKGGLKPMEDENLKRWFEWMSDEWMSRE